LERRENSQRNLPPGARPNEFDQSSKDLSPEMRNSAVFKAAGTNDMLKKLLLCVGMLSVVATPGCMTTEPTIYSWPHHKRRIRAVLDDLHEFHVDFDRVLFDMEEYPRELDY
jgi:hypothetical protein